MFLYFNKYHFFITSITFHDYSINDSIGTLKYFAILYATQSVTLLHLSDSIFETNRCSMFVSQASIS